MFNIIIRRAIVATAGAGIALTLMAAPASAAPRPDGEARRGATTETKSDEQASTANVTVTVSCDNVVTVTSDKDISHVEWALADGTVDKEEDLSGYTWTRTFDQAVVWAKGKSAETVVYTYADCDEQGPTPDGSTSDNDDNDTGVKGNDDDVVVEDDNDMTDDVNDEGDDADVEGDNSGRQPEAPRGEGQPNAAPEAFKCGDAMGTDVNGDGAINAADCSQVLGVVFERGPAASTAAPAVVATVATPARPGAQVLGVQFDRAPAALARTGTTFAPLLLAAVVLIASGILMVHGRRRGSDS